MADMDVLANEPANTHHFGTAHTHPLSTYSHDERLSGVASDIDRYIDHDISSANPRALTRGKLLIDLRFDSRGSGWSDTNLTGIAESQEGLDLRVRHCTRMRMIVGVKRYRSSYDLANRTIRQLEESNLPSARNDPKVIEGECKSRRKLDIVGIWGGYVDDIKDGNDKKGVNCFVPRDWLDDRYVAESQRFNKADIGDSASLSTPTLDLKRPIRDCPPNAYIAEDIDDLLKMNSLRWRTTFSDKLFKPVNRVCRGVIMERLVPLRYVKNVDHFKQAMREVVLVNHLVFSSDLRTFHRDINIHNLMVRYYDTSTLCSVLIDFDLVMMFGDITKDHIGTRTRSRQFMAWELLESDPPPIHLERFDWESFFYVISWIGCRYSEGKEVNKSSLSNWHISDDSTLTSIKRDWIFGANILPLFTPFYKRVALEWVVPLRFLFNEAKSAKDKFVISRMRAEPGDPIYNEKFDKVTLGGRFTWDRFWEILQN